MIAYNFRLQWMRDGGTPIKPLGREVDRKRYELVIRALAKRSGSYVDWPHDNYARAALISSAPGATAGVPGWRLARRTAIWRDWIDHVKTMNVLVGLEHPQLRSGEYPDNNDFPDQLYTRMGRRWLASTS